MRHALRFLFPTAGLLLLVGCEKTPASSAKVATGFESRSAVDTSSEPVRIATANIDTTITLGDWLKDNPKDSVSEKFPLDADETPVCPVSISRSSLANHRTVRVASFSITPPPGETLPTDTTRLAERVCTLRTILWETNPSDSADLGGLEQALASQIDAKLGPVAPVSPQPGQSPGIRTWNTAATTVVLGIGRVMIPIEGATPVDRSVSAHLVASRVLFLKNSYLGFKGLDYWQEKYVYGIPDVSDTLERDLSDADSAIAWARLPIVGADLNIVLAEIRRRGAKPGSPRSPNADSALIRATRAIHDTAPKLDPPRRAAALLAADLARYATVRYPPPNSDNPDARLFAAAQSIVIGPVDPSTSGYPFSRVWLWDAYELDSLGRVGHMAFVRMLKRGFNQQAECGEGWDFYKEMAQRGEADLRRGDTDPLVHYYIGSAYKSIFDFSTFIPEDTSIHNPSKAEGEAARLRAIEHYRVAMPGLHDPPVRRDAWMLATTLMLGKPGIPFAQCAGEDD